MSQPETTTTTQPRVCGFCGQNVSTRPAQVKRAQPTLVQHGKRDSRGRERLCDGSGLTPARCTAEARAFPGSATG